MSIIQFISISAIFQSLFFIIYLSFAREKNKYNNIIVGLLLLTLSVLTFSSIILSSNFFYKYFKIARIGNQFAFLFGPLFFLNIISFFEKDLRFKLKNILYFIPFFVIIIFYVLIKYNIIFIIYDKNMDLILRLVETLQNIIYIIITFNYIIRNKILSFKIDIQQNVWLMFIIFGSIILLTLRYLFFIVWDIICNLRWCEYTLNLYFSTSFLFFNTIFFIFFKKPNIFTRKKYKNSLLNEFDKDKYKNMIIKFMFEKKIYLDPDLSLIIMAEYLSISSKYLSQIINEVFHQNFFDFINSYRIEESKKLLLEKTNKKTILEILYEVGFNSKSTFNNAFKKYTGMTPKEFKRRMQLIQTN